MSQILHANNKTLDLSSPKIMGILNVTPDSFSDGGLFNQTDQALKHVDEMLKWGVDIIDIGAESTRPNAKPVSSELEIKRLASVVHEIRQNFPKLWISIDTSSPLVMEQMADLGADMWNDVRGLRRIGAAKMASQLNLPVIIMHSRGEPETMNDLATYHDVIDEVIGELDDCVQNALNAGVKSTNIIIDVGMGFAKNHEHHIVLMKHLDKIIAHFDLPMLFGVSRKRFLGELLNDFSPMKHHSTTDRDLIGAVAHLLAMQKGANIVRVHDVASMAQTIKMWQSVSEQAECRMK
ncbi:dihydropteroate synthase [Moraxella sp. Tifton1]|uniref:dihydropteroate synthase n=1 Tax=Moraxella oculi TaxID=2940516 RepID=UPI0020133B98|nr:dihydropteroate synthase [Moraxella sp. Tifton1]MCL1623805.1 dihydropteroate synthase [Moraxella sp. Tifton1]